MYLGIKLFLHVFSFALLGLEGSTPKDLGFRVFIMLQMELQADHIGTSTQAQNGCDSSKPAPSRSTLDKAPREV